MNDVPVFVPEEFYTGVCDEVRVVERGKAKLMEYGFRIGEFKQYTSVFLGAEEGNFGKSNDDQVKEDLIAFGADQVSLETGQVMGYIRNLMIGKTIEFKAVEFRKEIQFQGCRPPGKRRGANIVVTENPFGTKSSPKPAAGALF
jgi:hypothetical protein